MRMDNEGKTSKNTMNKVGLVLLVGLAAWLLLGKNGAKLPEANSGPKVVQKSAQLLSEKSSKDWGTAAKTTNGVNFELNVTAFLPRVAGNSGYYVFLKGDGDALKDMLIGKMTLNGDVYGLNYQSDMDYFGYKEIIVVKETESQAKANTMTPIVLNGTFAQ